MFRLYYSLVYPYLYYGNIIKGATYESNLKRLKILQKRVIRIITKSSYDVNTAPLFFEHRLLDIDRIHTLQLGLFMYSVNNSISSKAICDMFHKNSEVHSYPTRQCNAYRPQKCRTNIRKFTIISQGPKLWNSLPDDIKSKTTTNSFKINLKKYLLINASKQ